MKISVCIATYRRPERLRALLADLVVQRRLPDEVIVVDNDAGGSAHPVVAAFGGTPFALRYAVQPRQNIALTRNRTVALATGDWLAFVDDDERAPRDWLALLAEAAQATSADGVLGPVDPVLPGAAPSWLRHEFYAWARMPTGTPVPPNRLRFGNVLLRAAPVRAAGQGRDGPFDPAYGLTGGEDGDLLARLLQQGARIVWCDEALVHEPVEASRLSARWLLRRSLRGGQDFARHLLAGRYGNSGPLAAARLFVRALLQMLAAGLLALVLLPLSRARALHWSMKAAANLGKLSVFCGSHYREYLGAPA